MTTIDVFSLPPRKAIEQWQNKQINGDVLMRCLVSYDQWSIHVPKAAVGEALQQGTAPRVMFSRDEQGVSRRFIFSDKEAYNEYKKATGVTGEEYFLSTKGTWIFRLPTDEIDYVAIDPASPHEVAYGKDQFPELKKMADAIEVEKALIDLRTGAGPVENLYPLVLNYQGYRVAIIDRGDRLQMAVAPDHQGRTLAAVFTSDDAFNAFHMEQARQRPLEGVLQQLIQPGAQLFETLAKMPIDGIVFNCIGPVKPVAFTAQFAQLVLNS